MPTVKPTLKSVVEEWLKEGRTELSYAITPSHCKGPVSLTLRQRTCGCGCVRQYTPELTSIQRLEIQTLIEKLQAFFKKVVQEVKDFGTGLTFILVPKAN